MMKNMELYFGDLIQTGSPKEESNLCVLGSAGGCEPAAVDPIRPDRITVRR